MSYDLAFWRDPRPADHDPQAVYEELLEGRLVDGLEPFDAEAVLARLAKRFPGLERERDGYAVWVAGDASAAVEFSWSPQHLLATRRGPVPTEDLNEIVDACIEIAGGRLYDPQTGERFDSF